VAKIKIATSLAIRFCGLQKSDDTGEVLHWQTADFMVDLEGELRASKRFWPTQYRLPTQASQSASTDRKRLKLASL
jgi:hypothetical protein